MRGSRLLIGLLILATLLVDAVAVVLVQGKDLRHPTWILFCSLAISQVSLLAIWAGLGSKRTPWRVLGMATGVVAWSWVGPAVLVLSTAYDQFEFETLTTLFAMSLLTIALSVMLPLSIARVAGLCVAGPSHGSLPPSPERGLRWSQFSLGNLLGWTTAVALLLSMVPYVLHGDQLGRLSWPGGVVIAVGRAAIALTGLWMVLGARRLWLRILLLCSANGGLAAFWLLPYGAPGTLVENGVFLVLPTLLLVGSLGVFRVAGYRLKLDREE